MQISSEATKTCVSVKQQEELKYFIIWLNSTDKKS